MKGAAIKAARALLAAGRPPAAAAAAASPWVSAAALGSPDSAAPAAAVAAAVAAARPRPAAGAARGMSSFAAVAGNSKVKMLCMQCEQTANGTGCTVVGNCGKTPEVAALQDLLIHSIKGLGYLAHYAKEKAGIVDQQVYSFLLQGLFATVTNVNFDDQRFKTYIDNSSLLHAKLSKQLAAAGVPLPEPAEVMFFGRIPHPLVFNQQHAAAEGVETIMELVEVSQLASIRVRQEVLGATTAGLQELVMYGLKGMAAYAAHAEALGARDPKVFEFLCRSLTFLSSPEATDVGNLLGMALEVGECNRRVMELLSDAHADTFGAPQPTEVDLVPVPGKAILVTGHDMHDLHNLLQQTEGKGINVYTHGEMMPAHGYPGLKKYAHLKGNYGGAWYHQKMDFAYFPGAILATTNCVLEPMSMYRRNLFTTNATGLHNVQHVQQDYSAVIQRALSMPGFDQRACERVRERRGEAKTKVTVGFGHQAVLSVAGTVVDAVKTGKLRHIFLVGGCDGHEPQRDYYSKLGTHLPNDTMLLTLGCGKFRVYDQEFGMLADTGLPRLLDMGQCNDAHSALVVAMELAKAFNTDVNGLPLSLDISWFEQKAVAVLLTLLSLGVKNIRLGPAMPAFLTPEAVQVLVEKYDLKPADTCNPEVDLKKMMAHK